MIPFLKWAYLTTLAVWAGSIIFFSFVVAPTVFKVLKPEDAAQLQRALFPKYYLTGIVCAGIGLVLVVLLLADGGFSKWPALLSVILLVATGGTDMWLRQAVVPQMADLRDKRAAAMAAKRETGAAPDPELDRQWKAMHRLSVQINLAVLLCLLALLYVVVHRLV
jgi:hypothetical protein